MAERHDTNNYILKRLRNSNFIYFNGALCNHDCLLPTSEGIYYQIIRVNS